MTLSAKVPALAGLLFACVLLCPTLVSPPLAYAQQPVGARTSQSPSAQSIAPKSASPAPKATLAQFSWLAGHWQGDWGPRLAQQVWMPPQSGVMVGTFQLSENGRTLVVELYTIISTSHGIELRVRHFTPALTPWEKSGPALLNLESMDSKSVLFENADNGQPKHWLMKRTGADTFVARFEILPGRGQQQVAEIAYHRELGAAAVSH